MTLILKIENTAAKGGASALVTVYDKADREKKARDEGHIVQPGEVHEVAIHEGSGFDVQDIGFFDAEANKESEADTDEAKTTE